ncbi:ApaG protein [Lutibacter sp. Hel_I_33_5]|uniref:Co2+/Mg2+ efflux protein ApaG n=1 Tax=Lutibacter sp. Hel_I_33_5 TaxID=1566289 RepID=UPI0011A8F200|nr:Co2+/Mg2+ efflux protein ApaG [Lutibacter sp. Hel_I_33_5]TVZ56786.1 ApaG protein [Lutibacter sp. Hel_I_33_5]
MVQQITKGIKISVKTKFEGSVERNQILYHAFSYFVTILNTSENTVQLTDRFWKILDSLNHIEIVEGEGVIGQQPILKPLDSYTYKSGSYLKSTMGAMSGFYTMTNLDTQENFKVAIPTFQLIANVSSN